MKQRINSLAVIAVLALALASCSSPKVKVPDLSGTDVSSAKSIITGLGLVPTVEEEYSDEIEAELVISTDPVSGMEVEPNSKVKIVVSKGPSRIDSADSTITWTYVSSYGKDEWNYYAPYIEDGKLHINCHDVKFSSSVKWRDPQSEGEGFGQASITDTFDKSVPLRIIWKKQSVSYGEKQDLEIVIPVTDLDVQKPTTLYLRLFAEINGEQQDVKLTFTITW